MTTQKRALAAQDVSCVGKCSLTVALPVLSAAGVETSVLPTAVLSTHTGGFGKPAVRDLTADLEAITAHWKSVGLTFDALYTGYLASAAQVEQMLALFDGFGENALRLVDPVMGDHGRLYSGFSPDFPAQMARLCERAQVIVPNFTEAALLLDEPYAEGPYTQEAVTALLERLSGRFGCSVVLTGVWLEEGEIGAAALDRESGRVTFALTPRVPGQFHGTGDLFASALLAALLAERSLGQAAGVAAHFTAEAIRKTDLTRDRRLGVRFEAALPLLMAELGLLEEGQT